MPRLIAVGLAPAAMFFSACLDERAEQDDPGRRTVARFLFDFCGVSLAIAAPALWKESFSSISLAIVWPSLVMVGEPHDACKPTLRPRGPRVIGYDVGDLADALDQCLESFFSEDDFFRCTAHILASSLGGDPIISQQNVFLKCPLGGDGRVAKGIDGKYWDFHRGFLQVII